MDDRQPQDAAAEEMDDTEMETEVEAEAPEAAGEEAEETAAGPGGRDRPSEAGIAGDGDGVGSTARAGSSLDTELQALREEFEDLNDRHLRLAAEFNNYRRRVEQERLDTWARAQADLVGSLLDVLDDLQRVAALDLTSASVEGIMEGIDLVERKFVRTLEDAGAEVLEPEPGTTFDPESMEAMMRVPAQEEEADDTVAQLFQKGYAFKGKLVRPARVSVHKHDG